MHCAKDPQKWWYVSAALNTDKTQPKMVMKKSETIFYDHIQYKIINCVNNVVFFYDMVISKLLGDITN